LLKPPSVEIHAIRLTLRPRGYFTCMIILGLVLLLLGLLLGIPILWTAGIVVLIIGAILMLLGRSGRPVGGRAHYW
jgi:hypothetical protein